ncbi:MAG: hypothetical protein NWR81_01805 [Candidatus Nanopelagicales bacterium]|nr:hypothetical protein [Candidatus Nanopelagicales bacterium]MDP4652983.1 hypothetical protein [Candidatus Nanopelagicales bacterium]MDP4750905.1 hypothetical protein [Candidatus Nanopelagicales bacterium]MDP4930921.1 hypothetical protein [Candidatus Nanopelagicaceae bacterium]MDP5045689.1 hypothetical protein [Candidatus Nanopelagicaceae bacterium]
MMMSVPLSIVAFMIIDCDSCIMRDIACKDCVVSVLISAPNNESHEPSELGLEEARVIDLLSSRGMIPPLRYAQNEGESDNSQANQALSG